MEETDTFVIAHADSKAVSGEIQQKFGELESIEASSASLIKIKAGREHLKPLCKYLHDELSFEHVSDISGIDNRTSLGVVYHIYSYRKLLTVRIIVDIPNDDPKIDTISDIWGGANWHERETYDMFGIKFTGHPWLKRILLPEDFEGFPLTKKYKVPSQPEWNIDKEKALKAKRERKISEPVSPSPPIEDRGDA